MSIWGGYGKITESRFFLKEFSNNQRAGILSSKKAAKRAGLTEDEFNKQMEGEKNYERNFSQSKYPKVSGKTGRG